MTENQEPDFTSEKPGESMEFEEQNLDYFWIQQRRFDVEIEEAANGVWHASTQVTRSRNGRLYHPDHAPFDVFPQDVEQESETGPTPSEAFETLKGVVESRDQQAGDHH